MACVPSILQRTLPEKPYVKPSPNITIASSRETLAHRPVKGGREFAVVAEEFVAVAEEFVAVAGDSGVWQFESVHY